MLNLRKINTNDKARLVELIGNREVSQFMSDRVPYPYTSSHADLFFDVVNKTPNDFFFAIDVNGQFIGGAGLHRQPLNHAQNIELGYWIGKPYWGRGYASEAVKQVLNIAFSLPEINKVFARVFEGNLASDKVLLKNGFKEEGILRKHILKNGKLLDEKYFGLQRTEYNSYN